MKLENIHNLLDRQIKKFFGDAENIPEEYLKLLKIINLTYHDADSERTMMERSLEISSKELMERNTEIKAIFEALPDIFVRFDSDGKIINFKLSNTYDLPFAPQDPTGKSILELPIRNIKKKFDELVTKASTTDKVITYEHQMKIEKQRYVFEVRIHKVFTHQFIAIIRNITERKLAEEQLRHDALHDKLTDLPNRQLLLDRLEKLSQRAVRNKGYIFGVVFIDFDRFKVINESLGHLCGDELLIQISRRLKKSLRAVDTISRIGGDEFILLLDDINGKEAAITIAERIKHIFAEPFTISDKEIFLTASIGIALNDPQEVQEPIEYLRDADIATYHAKVNGKGRYEIFDKEMHINAIKSLDLETDLRRTIEKCEEFELYYQPIFDLKENKLVRMEALIRWNHPERGQVPPFHFIPLAEETGMILKIGEWVLNACCRQAKEWKDLGFPKIQISVNFSPIQFHHQDIPAMIMEDIKANGIPPEMIEVEITEGAAMRNTTYSFDLLSKIKNIGVKIAIDDFGMGYSSLSSLTKFPIDYLKLDRTFVKDLPDSKEGKTLSVAIITLGHKLGFNVVGEGIETQEQLDYLKQQGCDEAQGYFFAKPMPVAEATEYLKKHS